MAGETFLFMIVVICQWALLCRDDGLMGALVRKTKKLGGDYCEMLTKKKEVRKKGGTNIW